MTNNTSPILIYDGDCKFCFYWASYWRKLTGDAVVYKPYQEVENQFPQISQPEFKQAVQYVAPDGQISRAAKASFLTLSHAPSQRFWLTLYKKFPGFAFISEKTYAFIAAHRDFFYKPSVWIWGKEHEPPSYNLISWIFIRIFGLITLGAFLSFGVQALGLIGSQGIVPVAQLISFVQQQVGSERYWLLPMLFWINATDLMIQLVCWSGILFSVFLIFNVIPRISLLVIFICYLSLCNAGQVFMTFQWDFYLLEVALITFFLLCQQTIGIWLLRWLLFRFMLGGGLVKLFSGDPTWRSFTALSYYFETEPLPTPIAWYAHHLPQMILKFCTASTLFIELIIPFFIFLPRRIRFFSGLLIALLQAIILITGNYNFFNILTILLCLTLFDDAAIRKAIPHKITHWISSNYSLPKTGHFLKFLTYLFVIITVPLSLLQFYVSFSEKPAVLAQSIVREFSPLRMVNLYGPFAVMTTKRMEIIFEGSNDGINWQAYPFKYKPDDIYRRPPWNIPHQPRLDWQLWFAALGTVYDNPWVVNVMERILEGSKPVLELFASNPFPDKPPKYVRALFYQYKFSTPEEKKTTGAWWSRTLIGSYVQEIHLDLSASSPKTNNT
jgi:predicted DCC family thiol-disulfide oxidoreductase YuxK